MIFFDKSTPHLVSPHEGAMSFNGSCLLLHIFFPASIRIDACPFGDLVRGSRHDGIKGFLAILQVWLQVLQWQKKEIPHQLIGSPAIYRVLNIRGGLELLRSTAWFMIIVFSHAKQSDRLLSPMWCITWRAGPWFSMAKWCGKQHVFQVSLWLSCNLPGMYKSAFLFK